MDMLSQPSINHLPIELLSSILVLWSVVDEDAPWMASCVCHEWRRIVLACPMAWSNVSLILKGPHEPTLEDRAWCIEEEDVEAALSPRDKRRPLDLWFARSCNADLALTILVEQTHPHIEFRIEECIRILECHVNRLRFFSLQVESVYLAESLFSILPRMDLHTLELCIQETSLPRSFRGTHLSAEGYSVPALWDSVCGARHIEVHGCTPPQRRPEEASKTLALQVTATLVSPRQLASLLADHHNLTVLDVSDIETISGEDAPNGTVVLPSLTRLTVEHNYMRFLTNVFGWLRAPALTHLAIGNLGISELAWKMSLLQHAETSFEATAEYGKALARFVGHCPSLESLRISRSGIHDRHLADVLGGAPSLGELRVEQCLVGTPLLRALTVPVPASPSSADRDKPVICPNLRRLDFYKCDLVLGEHLVALVQSRNRAGSQTQRITDVHTLRCPNVSVRHVHELIHALQLPLALKH